jgi:hypothetical protein
VQITEPACSNIVAHFIQERSQSAALGEVSIDLAIPGGVFTLMNE